MSKVTLNATIEIELFTRISQIAKENNLAVSNIVERILIAGLQAGEPIQIKCIICNSIYSSKLGYCPACKETQAKRDLEIQTEINLNKLKNRLEQLEEWKVKGFSPLNIDRDIGMVKAKLKELEEKVK